jgi:hypothetical protein
VKDGSGADVSEARRLQDIAQIHGAEAVQVIVDIVGSPSIAMVIQRNDNDYLSAILKFLKEGRDDAVRIFSVFEAMTGNGDVYRCIRYECQGFIALYTQHFVAVGPRDGVDLDAELPAARKVVQQEAASAAKIEDHVTGRHVSLKKESVSVASELADSFLIVIKIVCVVVVLNLGASRFHGCAKFVLSQGLIR